MKKTLLFLSVIIFILLVPTTIQAGYDCPEGYYWSRETIACEQKTCPANTHRNYTLECICDDGYSNAERGPNGLVLGCSKINTESSSASDTTGSTIDPTIIDQSVPTIVPTLSSAPREFESYYTYVPSELLDEFEDLMEQYYDQIPRGIYGYDDLAFPNNLFTPGQLNNLVYGSNETACGSYQDTVLKWLLSLQFSDNSIHKNLIKKFDFGPIQIEKGAHQAVVLYPKGSDWRTTGIVLDPWVEQRPRIYTIQEWDNMFFLSPEGATGNILTPIDANTGIFPTTPDKNGRWEYNDVYSNKPRKPRNIRQDKGKQLLVQSPVAVLIQSDKNKSIGINSDGNFVNDFKSDVEASILLKSDNTYRSTFNLPDGNYTIKFTGTDSGEVSVYSSTGNNDVRAFDKVTVKKDDQLSIDWKSDDKIPTYKNQNDKTISSKPLEELKEEGTIKDNSEKIKNIFYASLPFMMIIIGIFALMLLLIIFIIFLLLIKKKNK